MSNLVWTENTKPDRPGIWMLQGSKNAITVYERDLSHDWFVGPWCFICDLPTIVDPPKYREVTAADVGRECEFSTDGVCYFKRRLIGFDGSLPVYHHTGVHYLACKHARILDSGHVKGQQLEPRLGRNSRDSVRTHHPHDTWDGS